MKINFVKYQGTGNDFVMIDNRKQIFPKQDIALIQKLTDRKFGIGADGLMLIENHDSLDFRMRYFNADGSESLCGNGSRCAVMFANELGIIETRTTFETTDGIHEAYITDDWVHFQLHDLNGVQHVGSDFFMNNGSPHHVQFVEEVNAINVASLGYQIRHSEHYQPAGTNVNFVQKIGVNHIGVRTFERGVEAETLSCGTGVTAAALVSGLLGMKSPIAVETPGGKLQVRFVQKSEGEFTEIYLSGPATRVFSGTIEC